MLSQPELRQLACLSSPVSGVSSSLNSISSSPLPHRLDSSISASLISSSTYSIHNGSLSRNLGPGKPSLLPPQIPRYPSLTKTLQPRNDVYGAYDPSYLQSTGPKTHTTSPAVTGTSVIGVKFNGGVALATDNLGMLVTLFPFHSDIKATKV